MFSAKDQKIGDAENDLNGIPEKGALDDQIATTEGEKDTWDGLVEIVTEKQGLVDAKQQEWDNRDQTLDNSAIETELNNLKGERDTAQQNADDAEADFNEENDKIPAL